MRIDDIRKQFPILNHKIQLSSCSQSAIHSSVKKSVGKYMDSWETDGMDWENWMSTCEEAREKFAKLINAKVSEISIVSSVSHGFSSIVTSLAPLNQRKDILVSEDDFPCIGHVTLSQQDFNVKFVDYNEDDLQNKINEKTLLTSIPHVSFYDGKISNIKEISSYARKNGSYTFVDAYQSAGQVNINVQELEVDFLIAGMQKYLLGLPGIAFLYVREDVAESMIPKITGWFGQNNPFAFDSKNVEYAKGAKRFDSGTYPMINGYAASSALDVLLDLGVQNIQEYLQELSSYSIEYSKEKGLEVVSPHNPLLKGSNTAIKVKNASSIEGKLKEKNVLVSARNDVIRIAPHFYNTKEDIKIAIDELVKLL